MKQILGSLARAWPADRVEAKPKGVIAPPVDPDPEGSLGFPPLVPWPSTQLPPQPLEPAPAVYDLLVHFALLHSQQPPEPETKVQGADTATATATPTALQPLPAEWHRTMKGQLAPHLNGTMIGPSNYVVNFSMASRGISGITAAPSQAEGLESFHSGAAMAFRAVIVGALDKDRPEGMSPREQVNFINAARTYADAVFMDQVHYAGPQVSLASYYQLCKRVDQLKGRPASEIDRAVGEMRNRALLADAPANSAARRHKGMLVASATAAILSGLAAQIGLLGAPPPSPSPTEKPFTHDELEHVLGRLVFNELEVPTEEVARLFSAIQTDPSLSGKVLQFVGMLLKNLTTGRALNDALTTGSAVASLVLSLPAKSLEKLMVTRELVETLASEAQLLVGYVYCFSSQDRIKELNATFEKHPERIEHLLDRFANEFRQTPSGAALAQRFESSLGILMRNAERLERYVEHVAAEPSRGEALFDQPLLTMLSEFEETPAGEPVPDAKTDPETEPEAKPTPAQQEPTEPREPARARRQGATRQPQPAAAETGGAQASESKDAILGLYAVHSGARPKGQPAHWHKREHRGLASGEKTRRLQTIEAWELGFLTDKYQKLTPEIKAAMEGRSQARRMAEQGTANISAGQRLIRPPKIRW